MRRGPKNRPENRQTRSHIGNFPSTSVGPETGVIHRPGPGPGPGSGSGGGGDGVGDALSRLSSA